MALTKKVTKSFSEGRWSELRPQEQCLPLSEVKPCKGGWGVWRGRTFHCTAVYSSLLLQLIKTDGTFSTSFVGGPEFNLHHHKGNICNKTSSSSFFTK